MKICRLIFLSVLMSVISFGADAKHGANLYDGTKSFKNGGVACIACHNVNNPKVVSGGSLAKDLTFYGGDMADTVGYMITSSSAMPSPLMVKAYKGKELTADEASDVVAFFKTVDVNSKKSGSGNSFWILGAVLAVIMFVLLSLIGGNRKKASVNQELYDRQELKSKGRDS